MSTQKNDKNRIKIPMPRVLLAADRSSSGKTTITSGLLAALTSQGYRPQPFKVGLDYIDPSYHSEITGIKARNLDGYLMDDNKILDVFTHAFESEKADLAVIEGVRGLFEGLESFSDTGSTAQIAKTLDCPVVLVINARSITRSAAAIVNGYVHFDPDVNIAGVILNNIGGGRHAKKAKDAIEYYTGVPVLGIIPRDDSMQISMRHLGLVPAIEGRQKDSEFRKRIYSIESIIKENVDIEKIIEISHNASPVEKPEYTLFKPNQINYKPAIGIALDEAFNFYYHNNIELLELEGARIKYFSPIHDAHLPKVDGLYIGGGYPELFGDELESNESMRNDIKQASGQGLPIYAECGGLMYLTEKMTTGVQNKNKGKYHMAEMQESTYNMVGALPGHTLMGHTRVVSYNIGMFKSDSVIGKAGNSFRGHEFHHSEITNLPSNSNFAIKLSRGTGIVSGWDGLTVNNTMGSYAHLEAVSYEAFASSFVDCIFRSDNF
jgi:cobyrinic acid a,c-diamide synthase